MWIRHIGIIEESGEMEVTESTSKDGSWMVEIEG